MTQSSPNLTLSERATIRAALVIQAAAFDARADSQTVPHAAIHDRARAAQLLSLAGRFK